MNLVLGSMDIGGTRASLAMQLAETLGLAAEDIVPKVVDTDSVGFNDVTGGSRTTFGTGYAVHAAGVGWGEDIGCGAFAGRSCAWVPLGGRG